MSTNSETNRIENESEVENAQDNVQCEVDVIEQENGFKVVEVLVDPNDKVSCEDFDQLLGKTYSDKSDIFVDVYDIVGSHIDTTIRTLDREIYED